jgi:muramoyltetrapeptide carboxypeptidase LdcA involved in peptidoglycan recycling
MKKEKRRIHITAVGSSASRDVDRLSLDGFDGMVALAQRGAGDGYRVTANRQLIYARHADKTGGRADDAQRAREVTRILADDSVAAMVTIRGGAWFTRILDQIDFDVLRQRKTPIYLFGFSEMTTLINIAGTYDKAIALYDMGPGFLFAAHERWAEKHIEQITKTFNLTPGLRGAFAQGYGYAKYTPAFVEFFQDVVDIIEGKGSSRLTTGRLLRGSLPGSSEIQVVGGTLSVVLPLVGSKFASAVDTRGKWIALEDINEDVDPIDRMMAGLRLAGLFDRTEGVFLGNFHKGDQELSLKAYHILLHHLPKKRSIPVVALDTFGHIESISPLPMHRPVMLKRLPGRSSESRVLLDIPWEQWAHRSLKRSR